jgi:type I restriction enzyme S subunit
MATFPLAAIGEVAHVQSGYAFKSGDWQTHGIPVVRIANVKAGSVDLTSCAYVSPEIAEAASRYRLRHGDILVSMTGYIGEIARVRTSQHIMLNQRVGRFEITDADRLLSDYFFYALQQDSLVKEMRAHAYGVAQPNISPTLIHGLNIYLPPFSTQLKIVAILSAYDDLIENNLRRIKILEEMVQNLYREWFVKFRFPGHQHACFTDSLLGRIPQEWGCGVVNDLVSLKSGFAFRSSTFIEDGTYGLVTIRNVHDGLFVPDCTNRIADLPSNMSDFCHLSTGDVLLSLTGNIGRVCLVYGTNYLLNQRVAKLVPNEVNNRAYVYLTFRQDEFQTKLSKIANGVAQQNLSPIETGKTQVVIPSQKVLADFAGICEPIVKEMTALFQENATLRRTRDLLLPRLISGEVDVSELDIAVPEETVT